ncbi:dolichyl-P-Man:Man(5)GlcNAc(2)-PP-dolichol alpha-1,3-mannosyltransferase [Lithohypha guttulata]|nr:dolichyl-P-Man:Man(5)GlcNAc(2)-PP-dolichol alpha-1,3-mannosyltransferase [Lithohypha guttulata]
MASHSALFHRKPERTSGSRNGVVEQIRASDLVRSPATEDSSPRTQILPKSSLFTTRMVNLHDTILSLLTDPWHTRWIAPCLVLLEIILCAGIVNYVSYTEIDWETYMIQVSKFLPPTSERNYSKIDGPTGPCVYPALHLYIHSALYHLTNHGQDIRLAQIIYAGLYLATLSLVFASYRRVNAPPWLLAPLVLSKRLHSIFLLRLFNDCWAAFFFWVAVYAATRKRWGVSIVAWSLALNVKMTMLLPFPALLVIVVQNAGTERAILWMVVAAAITLVFTAPFMTSKYVGIYLKQAFDLGRQFLYKWTVNWRFVSEELFLSKPFAYSLLAVHASLLLAFLQYRWLQPSGGGIWEFMKKHFLQYRSISPVEKEQIKSRITPALVLDSLLGSIVIGMVCARSLHYQFYAYLGWSTPYLLWRSGSHPVVVLAVCLLQELAWLTYPSTPWSSFSAVLVMALQVIGVWIAAPSKHPYAAPIDKKLMR